MKPLKPEDIALPESIEKAVVHYLIAKERHDSEAAVMKALAPTIIDRLKQEPGHRAVISGWELRLVKKNTIRARYKEYHQWGQWVLR